MNEDKWLGWVGLIIAFAIFQAVRAALRGAKGAGTGMARLNAAAERILKERGASITNPTPTRPAPNKSAPATSAAARAVTQKSGTAKRHSHAPLPKSTTPAVIRRNGILGGREPVIQRRH